MFLQFRWDNAGGNLANKPGRQLTGVQVGLLDDDEVASTQMSLSLLRTQTSWSNAVLIIYTM